MQSLRRKIKKTASTPRGKIALLIISLLIISAIAGGVIYWQVYRKQIIRERLESAIHEKTSGLYAVKYDKLTLDEVAGNLTVSGFTLLYDSLNFLNLVREKTAPPSLLRVRIPAITVSGVKTPRALLSKEIVGKKLQLDGPEIEIIYTNTGQDSARNVPTREVYEQILGNLKLIRIDTLQIMNAKITTRSMRTNRENIRMEGMSIQLTNVSVDSLGWTDTSRILFAKELALSCSKLSWASANRLYHFSADSVQTNSTNRQITVARFRIDPTLAEDAFVRSLPTQDDRFDFNIHRIDFRNIDIRRLFDERIEADSLTIGAATFKIYRDLGIVRDRKNRVGTYPHQALARLSMPVNIRRMVINNAFIEYKERSASTRKAGKVQFYNTRAAIANITNDKQAVQQNKIMRADIRTSFLNQASLQLAWSFYLLHAQGRFDIKGEMGPIDATKLNVLAEPMGPARIEEGKVNSLRMNLAGNDYSMNGTVRLLYENLKISLLEKDEETKKLEKKKLASLAANLVIKNNNPSGKKDEPRVASVTNDRNTNRSIFHLSWKTLFKGIKETAGIN